MNDLATFPLLHQPRRARAAGEPLTAGDIRIELDRYRVWRAGRPVELTTREFRLLTLLMTNPGRVFTRDEILAAVWGTGTSVSHRNVDACVKRLRKALVRAGQEDPIRTVRLVGYAFDELFAEPAASGIN